MREVPPSWVSSLELGWALLWRFLLIAVPLNLLIQQWRDPPGGMGALIELIVLVGSVTAAVHWVRVSGYRRWKLVVIDPSASEGEARTAE